MKVKSLSRARLLRDLPNPGVEPRWILYHLSQQGSPRILEWVAMSFSSAAPARISKQALKQCGGAKKVCGTHDSVVAKYWG